MDGLAVRLLYRDGQLVQAVTRGNGEVGEDVTHNARKARGVPPRLPAVPGLPKFLEAGSRGRGSADLGGMGALILDVGIIAFGALSGAAKVAAGPGKVHVVVCGHCILRSA